MDAIQVKQVQWKSDAKKDEYARKLKEDIKKALSDREKYDKERAKWLKQHEGRLERTDDPASWQSRIDIPTTREVNMAIRARLVNPIIQQDKVMVTQPRKPEFEAFSRQVEDFLDYAFDQFPTQSLFMEWVENSLVYGMGVLKTAWTHEQRLVKEWRQVPVSGQVSSPATPVNVTPGTGASPVPGDQISLSEPGGMQMMPAMPSIGVMQPQMQMEWREVPELVDEKVGVFPKVIPPSDFIYPSTSVDVDSAHFIDHRVYLDEGTVKKRIREGEWQVEFSDLSKVTEIDEVTKTREQLLGLEPSLDRFEIHEVYQTIDVDEDGVDEDIIVTMDYGSGKIVRAIENYYHDHKRPFIPLWWEKRPNSMDSMSMCYILSHLHQAYSAIINMLLDAGTLAVKGYFVGTTDQQLVELFKSNKIHMGDFILLSSLPSESTEVFKIGQPPSDLLQLAGIIQQHINLLSSINLYNYGIEQTDRPTATGQNLLVEEGKQPLFEKLEIVRSAISDLSIHILSRYKQFYQNEAPYSRFVNQTLIPELLKFPPGIVESKVLMEPKASSAMLSETTRKQEIVALLDRIGQSWRIILELYNTGLQAAAQGLPEGMVAAGAADSYQFMLIKMLQEFKVSDVDKLMPNVNALKQIGSEYQMMIKQMQERLSQITQQAQQLAMQLQDTVKQAQDLAKENQQLQKERDRLYIDLQLEKMKPERTASAGS